MANGAKIFAAVATLVLLAAAPARAQSLAFGKPAPAFQATTLDGRKITLADLTGQVVVINIWATWCGPCKAELPLLDAYERAARQYGLRVIAITPEDSVPSAYLRSLPKGFVLTLAHDLHGGRYDEVNAFPTNYVIDRRGVLRYAKAGAFSLGSLNQTLVPLLNEPDPGARPQPAVGPPAGQAPAAPILP